MRIITKIIFLKIFLIVISSNILASEKTIYIKPFAIRAGVSMNDPSVTLIKDYISEYITEKEEYIIITDDEVKQIIKHEELKMTLDKCYDDSCIKKLMKSIKTDYIIYGTFAYINYKYIITAKMLDRTSGAVKLAKVKTLEFKNKNKMKKAAKDLAAYIIDDEDIDMDEYEDALKKRIKKRLNIKKKNFVKKFKGYFEPYFCNDVIDKDGDGRVDFYRTGKEKELLGTKLVNGKLISKKYFNTNEKIMIGVRFKNSIGMKPRIKIWDKKNNLIRDSIFNSIVDKDESNRTWYNPNELKEGLYKVEFYIDNLFVGKDYFYVSE